MKCLNCGCAGEHYLCSKCATADILDKVFNEIRFYKPETCENPYLAEYVSGLSEKYEERNCIPEILKLFDFEVAEYYYCLYFRLCRDPRFEEATMSYLSDHPFTEEKSQRVVYELLNSYLRNDFIKPQKWCEIIVETDNLCAELYGLAAQFYSMIGEYDLSDQIADKVLTYCDHADYDQFLFYSRENMIAHLNKQKDDTQRYRTKKPYWPSTEERRRAVAMFYDEKGIRYPRITKRPPKVAESDFAPINECFEDELQNYCSFWCEEAYSISAAKSIYQIGAIRIRENTIVDSFQSLIRPWDNAIGRKDAAKKAGVSLETIETAEDVDLVIPKFFEFVGSDILVSTSALGNQAKLISRAARYAGMVEIKNGFWDLLDVAADIDADFDLDHNTREYLLEYFEIPEGDNALGKAKANVALYQKLKAYGDANA